jgi:hypothetical protein
MNGQIIYDLALVQDRGTHWFVTNVTQNTLDNLVNKDEKILKLSYMSHQLIKEALMSGKKVHVQKNALRTTEVLPGEFTIIDGVENNELENYKESSIIKVRMLVTPELSKISSFSMYGFIVLNNDLSSAGYFITNENREEKYLEILETGDEQLIQKLEDYLNYKDEIEQLSGLERKFSKFRKDIQECDSKEKVETLEKNFLEKFYSDF